MRRLLIDTIALLRAPRAQAEVARAAPRAGHRRAPDTYWGDDAAAAAKGARMGGPGRSWLLLPEGVTR